MPCCAAQAALAVGVSAARYGMSTTGGAAHLELSRAGRLARAAELLELGRTEHALAAIEALRAEALLDDTGVEHAQEHPVAPIANGTATLPTAAQPGSSQGGLVADRRVRTLPYTCEASAGAEAPGFSAALQSGQFSEDELVARALHTLAA